MLEHYSMVDTLITAGSMLEGELQMTVAIELEETTVFNQLM